MTEVENGYPLRPVRRARDYRSRGGFKTIELNAAGWSALAGAGAAAGAAASLVTRAPLVGSVFVAMVGSWAALLAADHRRWRNSIVSVSWDDLSEEAYSEVIERLRAVGISASYREFVDEETGDGRGAVECRQADLETAEKLLDDLKRSLR